MSTSYDRSEKFKIGCQAVGGKSVTDISNESGMSRAYVYQQKDRIEAYAQTLDEAKSDTAILEIDKRCVERTILSLALDCSASEEGIQRFIQSVYKIHVSIGTISGVLKKGAKKR